MLAEIDPFAEAFRCSVLSQSLAEPLIGTAVRVDVWLLLEYNGPWLAKATSDNDLPAPVQAWLAGQLAALAGRGLIGRLQFIRQPATQPASDPRPGLAFFVALARELAPAQYAFPLAGYDDLRRLDLPRLLDADNPYQPYRRPEPLYLVCTNGRRDRCCAQFGTLLHGALAALAPAAVWQTTHLGGHRFAPTLLTLPDGAYYGRLTPEQAAAFYATRQSGRLWLDNWRGRCCYPEPVQAADYHLRRLTGQTGLADFRHATTAPRPGEGWRVTFTAVGAAPGAGQSHVVDLAPAEPLPIYASCESAKIEASPQYCLVDYRRL